MGAGLTLPPGVMLTPLRRISNPKGDVLHAMKSTDPGFVAFGEAYFSTVIQGQVKGWKQHHRMTLNLVVPVGSVDFYLRDASGGTPATVRLGEQNYQRLTVAPGIWMAFAGVSDGLNLLLNLADLAHDPDESTTVPLERFSI